MMMNNKLEEQGEEQKEKGGGEEEGEKILYLIEKVGRCLSLLERPDFNRSASSKATIPEALSSFFCL